MILTINEKIDMPIYQQIRNQIIMGIVDGSLAAGEQLPTVRALAKELGINVMTVSKAYQLLKEEGYIEADKRRGARVKASFENRQSLSETSYMWLKQIISEAKICGMTEDAFLQECKRLFEGGTV